MKENLKGIVLGSIRHSDRHNVTNVFTRERGRMALLTPVGATKRGRQAASRLMPMGVVEIQMTVSAIRDLHIPSSVTPLRIWRSLYFDPYKSTIVLFLAEFLQRILRDAPPEPRLWDFIVDAMGLFDAMTSARGVANFHIAFLVSMMPMMGIQPDLDNYRNGMEFDMKAGTMVFPFASRSERASMVDAEKAAFLPILSRMNFANAHIFRFNGRERSELLEKILKYYGCHFPGCDNLKSLDIMREVFL